MKGNEGDQVSHEKAPSQWETEAKWREWLKVNAPD